LRFSSGFR